MPSCATRHLSRSGPGVVALALVLNATPVMSWQVEHRLVVEHGRLSIDHGKGVAEITRAQAGGGFPAEIGLGLFQNRMTMELSVDPVDVGRRGKRLSLLTRIRTQPVIYVARELPAGSCAYQVVLNHELCHQRFDLEVLRGLSDELRRAARDFFTPEALDRATDASLARDRERFIKQLKYTYDALSFPRHGAIDSPQSYIELSGRCQGEIGRRLAAR